MNLQRKSYSFSLMCRRYRPIYTVEGVCNVFLPYTRFLGFPEFSGYHQWQQESQ